MYWLPPNDRVRAGKNVHVRDGSADVHERDDPPGLDGVVRLVRVLEGERVDVHERGGLADLRDDARVVADLVLLDGDEEHIHRLAARGVENDVIEVHVVDVEGDVLLGFPPDRLGELLGRHGRQGNLLDDHGMAGEGGPEVVVPDRKRRDDPVDRVDDEGGVHDRAVDDRLGGEALHARLDEAITPAFGVFQLDQFDRRRTYVEANQVF